MSDLIEQDGALREDKSHKLRFDLIPLCQLKKLALHYTEGGLVHGDRNRESGGLKYAKDCKKSAFRHLIDWMDGKQDERHDMAIVWNIFAYNFLINKNTENQGNETGNQS